MTRPTGGSKRLVLTSAGVEMKQRVERAMVDRSPWRQALTPEERATLISLIHKMAPPLSATNPVVPVRTTHRLAEMPDARLMSR